MPYLFLVVAIVTEVLGTISLQLCNQFTKLWSSIFVLVFYFLSFYFMSLAMRHLSTAFVYSVWSAVGMVLIGIIGYMFFKQKVNIAFIIGTTITIIGIVIMCSFSKTIMH